MIDFVEFSQVSANSSVSATRLSCTLLVLAAIVLIPTSMAAAQDADSPAVEVIEIGNTVERSGQLRFLSGDELEAAALQLEQEVAELGGRALAERLDRDEFIRRITVGRALGALGVYSLRRELVSEDLFVDLDEILYYDAHYSFRELINDGDHQRARFRLMDIDGGLNYHDVLMAHSHDDTFKVIDLELMASGVDLSNTIGSLYEELIAAAQSTGGAGHFLNLVIEEDYHSAWDAYSTKFVSSDNKHLVLFFRLGAAYQIGDREVIQAAHDFANAFPGTPAALLTMLDAYFFSDEYEQALVALDELQEVLGNDAALDTQRSYYYLAMEEYGRAAEFARRATEQEPGVYPIVSHEFDVALEVANYERVIDLMDLMESEFDLEFDPFYIEAAPEFSGLILTEAYREWRATREGPEQVHAD